MRRGFTFIEVLVILIVVSIGLMGAIGLISYGTRLGSKSQAEAIALSTAVSVATDPLPRMDPRLASGWTYTPYDFDGNGTMTSIAKGFINGVYVERTETSLPGDVIARGLDTRVQARSARVDVTVYESISGSEVASFTTRIVRQRGSP
jgi:prepilin-type N-terminal cleavage/methylation domain-containing protein